MSEGVSMKILKGKLMADALFMFKAGIEHGVDSFAPFCGGGPSCAKFSCLGCELKKS
jgi:hypothetical protein